MKIRTFSVSPTLPRRLNPLLNIAYNIAWSWMPSAVQLFQRIDLDAWEACYHNPVKLLGELSQERLDELLGDESFLNHMDDVALELEDYLHTGTWFDKEAKDEQDFNICYFSMEFGLHESIPIYSGGLGLLAGDHLKSASDLGLPLIGIGFLYRQGYFRQYLNAEGWQQEKYPENDFATLPLTQIKGENDEPLVVHVDLPGRQVALQVWRLDVGRVKLYMIDANLPVNSLEDREITGQLYGGDLEMRIKQEIVLGIGGIRLLQALGIKPWVCHMNEGHSAFLAIERILYFMRQHSLSFSEASEVVTASNVFTTHTPVPAGNDVFPPEMIDKYFKEYYGKLNLGKEQFLGLGRQDPFDRAEPFCMTVLAMRLAAHRNGVSKLHGEVSRDMWKKIWPGLGVDETPVDHITNGVHSQGWISTDMHQLFNRYLGFRWRSSSQEQKAWKGMDRIPDAELWRTHERRRERLVAFARKRLARQLENRGALRSDLAWANDVLDPEALTLGFARRFATYKRGALILSDPDRLEKILNDKDRPVQILFAGKAHPQDNMGKEVIKKLIQTAREPRFRNRIVFIEDYDINVARYLVQGVDVWINTPRRPLEASGTSGMKVAVNGGINLSIPDGWWDEAYCGDNGWSIGQGEYYTDHDYQDEVEARALYDILEGDVVPTFYDRGGDGVPRGWTNLMKRSIRTICPQFNTNRMVIDYLTKFYLTGKHFHHRLRADDYKVAKDLAGWKNSMRHRWVGIEITHVESGEEKNIRVGQDMPLKVHVRLPEIDPKEVVVEIYSGKLDSKGGIREGHSLPLELVNATDLPQGEYLFEGSLPLKSAGRHGYGIRVLPKHPDMGQRFEPGLILWE